MAFVRRSGDSVTGSGATVTVLGSGLTVVEGDLIYAALFQEGTDYSNQPTVPAGFTTFDTEWTSTYGNGVYGYKMASSDDESADFEFEQFGDYAIAFIEVYASDAENSYIAVGDDTPIRDSTADPSITNTATAPSVGALSVGWLGGESTSGITVNTTGFTAIGSDSISGFRASIAYDLDSAGQATFLSFTGLDSPYYYSSGYAWFVEKPIPNTNFPLLMGITSDKEDNLNNISVYVNDDYQEAGDLVIIYLTLDDSAVSITDSDGLTIETLGNYSRDYLLWKFKDDTETNYFDLTFSAAVDSVVRSYCFKHAEDFEIGSFLSADTAFTFRDSNEAQVSAATSLTLTKPTGLQVGDLITVVTNKSGTADWTGGPSWTEEATVGAEGQRFSLFWTIADAADVAASNFTWTWTSSEDASGVISAFDTHGLTPAFGNVGSNTVRLDDITPASNTLNGIEKNMLLIGSAATVNGTGSAAGLGMVTTGLTLAGNPTSGTGTGDAATLLAYKTAAGTEAIFEVNNAAATADSYVHYWHFSIRSYPFAPSFTPSWGEANTRWTALFMSENDPPTIGNILEPGWTNVAGWTGTPTCQSADKYETTATQDVATIDIPDDLNWATEWLTFQVAIQPKAIDTYGTWDMFHMASTNSYVSQDGIEDQAMVLASNGNRVAFVAESVPLLFSDNDGQTWSGMPTQLPVSVDGVGDQVALFMDENDYLHFVHTNWGTQAYTYWYGTPNTGRTNWTWQGTASKSWAQSRDHVGQVSFKAFDWGGDSYVILLTDESYGSSSNVSLQHHRLRWDGGVGGTLYTDVDTELYQASGFAVFFPCIEFRTEDGLTVDTQPDYWLLGAQSSGSDYAWKYTWTSGTSWTKGTQRTPAISHTSSILLRGAYNANNDRWSMMQKSVDLLSADIYERDLADTTYYTESSPDGPDTQWLSEAAALMDNSTGNAVIFRRTDGYRSLSSTHYDRATDTWFDGGIFATHMDLYSNISQTFSAGQRMSATSMKNGFDFTLSVEDADVVGLYNTFFVRYTPPPIAGGGWGVIII